MINIRTLLILGAGSNCQYGFPTADELIRRIDAGLNQDRSWPLKRVLDLLEFPADLIADFRKHLVGSWPPSIDTFLEVNQRYEEIGKACIASILLENEQSDLIRNIQLQHNEGWYSDLFKIMVDGASSLDHFKNNRLGIITYNYDRSLEYFLAKRLHHYFQEKLPTIKEGKNQLDFLEVTHVHGALGEFLGDESDRGYIEYGTPPTAANIKKCVNNIRVIHQTSTPHAYDNVYSLIKRCEQVIFLGFSYGKQNLDRLLMNRDAWNGKFIHGTVYSLSGQKLREVQRKFRELGLGPFGEGNNQKCEDVLKEHL